MYMGFVTHSLSRGDLSFGSWEYLSVLATRSNFEINFLFVMELMYSKKTLQRGGVKAGPRTVAHSLIIPSSRAGH